MKILLEDTRQQNQKHSKKHDWFTQNGIEIRRCRLYVGDYTLPADQSVCVDTKKDIQELVSDICGKQHERFRSELLRAKEAGIKLVILVENDYECVYSRNGKLIENHTINDLKDLHKWVNPRLWIFQSGKQKYPNATKGVTLQKACMTMEKKYGCEFLFCSSSEAGQKIVELLEMHKNS